MSDDAQRGAALVRGVAREVRAPLALRERLSTLQAERARAEARRAWWRRVAAVAGTACAAAGVLLAGTGASAPSLPAAEAFAAAPFDRTAVPRARGDAAATRLAVDGVRFPVSAAGWRAIGQREGSLEGRPAAAVAYRTVAGAEVRYAIVGGAPLTPPAGRTVRSAGVSLVLGRLDGHRTITWRRGGRTCLITVVAGRVPDAKLVEAARWRL